MTSLEYFDNSQDWGMFASCLHRCSPSSFLVKLTSGYLMLKSLTTVSSLVWVASSSSTRVSSVWALLLALLELVKLKLSKTWQNHWASMLWFSIALIKWTTEVWEEFSKDLLSLDHGDALMNSTESHCLSCLWQHSKLLLFWAAKRRRGKHLSLLMGTLLK